MLAMRRSDCINHTGVEATHRCKQCSKPLCDACAIPGPTGFFCSEACKEKHEFFVNRAQELEVPVKRPIGVKIRKWLGRALVLIIILIALGMVASVINIPVITPATYWVRNLFGV